MWLYPSFCSCILAPFGLISVKWKITVGKHMSGLCDYAVTGWTYAVMEKPLPHTD